MTITNAGLTAALAPVRDSLNEIERYNDGIIAHDVSVMNADSERSAIARGRLGVVNSIRAALDRIHPEPDVLAALGMVAIGMLRELRERRDSGQEPWRDWMKRADELLAAAYPIEKAANPAKG